MVAKASHRADHPSADTQQVIDAFDDNYRRISAVLPSIPVLLTVRMAMAVNLTLGSQGCALTMFRAGNGIPLGASDDLAAACQRQQVRDGQGPLYAATDTGLAVTASLTELCRKWPALADFVQNNTHYRQLISAPVSCKNLRFTLDVWFSDEVRPAGHLAGATTALAHGIATAVTRAPFHWPGLRVADRGGELTAPTSLLLALGMISSTCNRNLPSALGALVDHSRRVGIPLDQVADDIARNRCSVPSFSPTGL